MHAICALNEYVKLFHNLLDKKSIIVIITKFKILYIFVKLQINGVFDCGDLLISSMEVLTYYR